MIGLRGKDLPGCDSAAAPRISDHAESEEEKIEMEWYLAVLQKYAVFDGRARRKEYWYFSLFNFLIMLALTLAEGLVSGSSTDTSAYAANLYNLAVMLPSIGVSIRRLHDTGRSGWWLLIALIPLVGAIVLLVFLAQDSETGANSFGSNPKGFEASPA